MRIKYGLNMFSIIEYVKMEKHLESMAERGWMLKKVGSFLWKYVEIEPKKLHFSIVFFPKTTVLEPEPSDNLLMFREFCEKTGWKLAGENGQMQIFYNEAEEPVPIETECWVQLKNIHETAKTSVILTYGILVANAVLQMLFQGVQFYLNPMRWLSATYNICLALLWVLLGIGSLVEIIHYMLWHKKAKKIAEEENCLIEIGSLDTFRVIYLGLAFAVLALAILSLVDYTSGKYGFYVLLFSAVTIGVPFGVSRFFKARKLPAKVNLVITCVTAMIAALLMTGGLIWSIAGDADEIFHENSQMPLQIRDLYTGSMREENESYQVKESMILAYIEAWEHAECEDSEEEWISLNYEMVQVKADWAYDLCRDTLIRDGNAIYEGVSGWEEYGFKKVDMSRWQADEVYQLYTDRPRNEFIVCYEDLIIRIDFGWDVTEEEMQKCYKVLCETR